MNRKFSERVNVTSDSDWRKQRSRTNCLPHWDFAAQLGLRFQLFGNRAMAEPNRALAANARATKERLAMNDDALETILGKARRLQELRRAKELVRQLERKLRGEPTRPEESTYIPEFLRLQASSDPASRPARRSESGPMHIPPMPLFRSAVCYPCIPFP